MDFLGKIILFITERITHRRVVQALKEAARCECGKCEWCTYKKEAKNDIMSIRPMEKILPKTPNQTGYKPDKPDPRDVEYSALPLELGDIPDTYLPEYDVVPDYQGQRPFCVLHSVAYLMRLKFNEDLSEPFLAAYAEWHENGQKEPYTPSYGTYFRSGLWAAQNYGAPPEELYPPDKSWQELAQIKNIPEEAKEKASKNKIGLYTSISGRTGWNNNPEERELELIKDAIVRYKGVLVGVQGWNSGWYGELSRPVQNEPVWLHAIVFDGWKTVNTGDCGINKTHTHFRYANWWDYKQEARWGGYGRGWICYNEYRPYMSGLYVITDYNRDDIIKPKKTMKRIIHKPTGEQYLRNDKGEDIHIVGGWSLKYLTLLPVENPHDPIEVDEVNEVIIEDNDQGGLSLEFSFIPYDG